MAHPTRGEGRRTGAWTLRRVAPWLVLAVVLCSGCAGQAATRILPPPEPPNYVYRMGPEDMFSIRFIFAPNLNVPATVIPADGHIRLPLIGPVMAAGKTPEEFQGELQELYGGELDRPELVVTILRVVSQRVFVGGEVDKPELQSYYRGLTVYTAIQRAGGGRRSAKPQSVLVIRGSPERQATFYRVDVLKIARGEMRDMYLEPFDVVIVPRKFIYQVNDFVWTYIDRVIPYHVMTGFSFYLPLRPRPNSNDVVVVGTE